MKTEQEILINQYGQGLAEIERLISLFEDFDNDNKRIFLNEFLYWFVIQSKPKEEDIGLAITTSKLKQTYTPCVLLRKGVAPHNLQKILELPDNELKKVFILLLNLFKIAYNRRFEQEKNNPNKWWYCDLSDTS
jgi:hypothetical protein